MAYFELTMIKSHFIFKKRRNIIMNKLSLSLVTLSLLTSAAVADISSKSFGGSASLFYGTNDANDGDFFDKGTLGQDPFTDKGSYGNAAVQFTGAANVGNCDTCVTLNYGLTGVSTMGLENTLVNGTWINHTLDDAIWIDTLNLTFNPLDGISNTTMVLGRQSLDTPMVFTETWNIAQNTFDAAVAVNNDIQDTTLVGAWVGRSNNAGSTSTVNATDGFSDNGFDQFLTSEGAYAFGAVTKLIPTVTAQAWYYIAPSTAKVAWLQADTEYAGFGLGAQYSNYDADVATDSGNAYAVKIGYSYEGLNLSAAYSSLDENANTVNLGNAQSKLYTEAWWNFGYVSKADTDSFNITAEYSLDGIADLGIYYTNADNAAANDAGDMSEITVTAGKDLGNLNLSLAYINSDLDGAADAQNDVQVYAVYSF